MARESQARTLTCLPRTEVRERRYIEQSIESSSRIRSSPSFTVVTSPLNSKSGQKVNESNRLFDTRANSPAVCEALVCYDTPADDGLLARRVSDFLSGATELTAADLSNRKTYEANHNRNPVQTILSEFRVARLRLIEQVEAIDPALFSRAILHPRLKTQMRLVDHLYFMAEHDDHHLAQIWDLIHPEPHKG
jgi:hypothetical protein